MGLTGTDRDDIVEPSGITAILQDLVAATHGLQGEIVKAYLKRGPANGYGFTLTVPPSNGVGSAPGMVQLLPLDPSRRRAVLMGASATGLVFGDAASVGVGNGVPVPLSTANVMLEIKAIQALAVGNTTAAAITVSVWVETD